MVKVVHVSSEAAAYLTAEELSGWPEGIKYTPGDTLSPPSLTPAPARRMARALNGGSTITTTQARGAKQCQG